MHRDQRGWERIAPDSKFIGETIGEMSELHKKRPRRPSPAGCTNDGLLRMWRGDEKR